MELEALRLAENFFSADPQVLALVRELLLGALERWPDTAIVPRKSQVGLSGPRPFCALYPARRAADRREHALGVSLFLGRPLPPPATAVEAYPGRFTNHIVLRPETLDETFWLLLEEARQFRNP